MVEVIVNQDFINKLKDLIALLDNLKNYLIQKGIEEYMETETGFWFWKQKRTYEQSVVMFGEERYRIDVQHKDMVEHYNKWLDIFENNINNQKIYISFDDYKVIFL